MSTVGIIDYGLGNLTSVAGAVEKVGHEPLISRQPDELACTDRLVLPGVGAFGDGIGRLRERGLVEPLGRMVLKEGKPILGICLGSQLLGLESDEFGRHEGLGWVDLRVKRLAPAEPGLRVPHVGWNDLFQVRSSVLFEDVPEDALFYYVHSHCLTTEDGGLVTGECDYGGRFVGSYERGNIYATQFHPEKSQLAGLTLLRNFIERA